MTAAQPAEKSREAPEVPKTLEAPEEWKAPAEVEGKELEEEEEDTEVCRGEEEWRLAVGGPRRLHMESSGPP